MLEASTLEANDGLNPTGYTQNVRDIWKIFKVFQSSRLSKATSGIPFQTSLRNLKIWNISGTNAIAYATTFSALPGPTYLANILFWANKN